MAGATRCLRIWEALSWIRGYGKLKEGCADAMSSRRQPYAMSMVLLFTTRRAAYSESNLRMSACEYDAPMIFLFSEGVELRQNGDVVLAHSQ